MTKISQLLDDIQSKDLVLPEFQREYVWTKEQAKQLMVSLYKQYPVGGLLFWKTDNPPALKNLPRLPESLGTMEVILDGQQRLTTLYILMRGDIPPYYTPQEVTDDPRGLYFNLRDGDFQYHQKTRMSGNPAWQSVVACFRDNLRVFDIAKDILNDGEDLAEVAEGLLENLTRLKQVGNMDLPVQMVPMHASIEDAIDIFDRVNSQGTKLTDAELALTHVTAKWPQARREMKKKIEELDKKNFSFDLTFTTRALTATVTKHALFEQIHKRPKPELLDGWDQLKRILDYLVSVLPAQSAIHSTQDVNTTNAFIPLIAYLAQHRGHFPSEMAHKQAVHWLYSALIWSRYTAQTDQRLERDLTLVTQYENPWEALEKEIIDQRGRLEVTTSDLEGRGSQHPLYRMLFVLSKQFGAVDWFNGVPLSNPYGKYYQLHSHHIFPTAYLYRNGYDSGNHLHVKLVNSIANRAFLTASSNWVSSDTPPEEYFPEVEKKYPGALSKQFVPMEPELWRVERYDDFLKARQKLIARNINEFMAGLITEPIVTRTRSISDLIQIGESVTMEFKSTLQWNVVTGEQAPYLRKSVLKTICAFLNSEGGTLIIGVEDDGNIFGLERDIQFVKGKDLDGFELLLMDLIGSQIGPEFARSITVRFEEINGKQVCALDVSKAGEPAFLRGERGKEFYIRLGNTSRALEADEAHRYISTNWE